MKLSISIIGRDEGYHLEELLPQLSFADEIIYVDCESSDNSLQIAKKYGCRTYARPNFSHLYINKSYGIQQAKGDWILYLDPDERIPPPLAEELKRVIASKTAYVAFRIARRNYYLGRWLRFGKQYPDWQLRLFSRRHGRFRKTHRHTRLQIDGAVGRLKNDMLHYSFPRVSDYIRKANFYSQVEAEHLKESGATPHFFNALRFLVFKPLSRFLGRYILLGGFLDGIPGLFSALYSAFNIMTYYFKLWELQNGRSQPKPKPELKPKLKPKPKIKSKPQPTLRRAAKSSLKKRGLAEESLS